MGFYPDGTNKETVSPVKEVEKPIPVSNTTIPELVPKDKIIVPPPDEKLANQKFVIDTFHNITSVNTDRAAQVVADLKGFAEGSHISVTYYKQSYAESDVKGIGKDPDIYAHKTHKSSLKIHGFEIRLLGSMNYEHDAQDNVNRLTGEAVTYPGFQPEQGDKFIYEVETGKFGEFEISEIPTRMSIKSSTYFKIQFTLTHWMSPERAKILDEFVISEAWFDKQRFLNEPGALLYHNEYVEMKFMELQSAQLVTYYNAKFLDKTLMYTFMRPDGVYDPYVTDFMLKITDYHEAGLVAAQLYRDAPAIETSIWRALLSETVPLAAVPSSAIIAYRRLGSKTVLANSLINRYYVAWEPDSMSLADFFGKEDASGDEETDPCDGCSTDDLDAGDDDRIIGDLLLHLHPHYRECVLTCEGCACCTGDNVTDSSNSGLAYILEGSDDYKKLIRLFLKSRKIDIDLLHKCILEVYKLPKIEQFYKIPILVFLARTAIRYIHCDAGIYE